MSRRRAFLVALLLVGPFARGATWIELSDDCLAGRALSPQPSESLERACPELSAALRADPWNALLLEPADETPARSLDALRSLAEQYQRGPRGPRIDRAGLDAALGALPPPPMQDPPSLWSRVVDWLLGLLDDDGDRWPRWLAEWIERLSLPDALAGWVWYGAAMVLVLLAVAVVVNELRRRPRRRAIRRAALASAPGTGAEVVERPGGRSSPGEQLEVLFRGLVERLLSAGLLTARASLTHREIAATHGLSGEQRDAVSALSGAAERATYGDWSPLHDEIAPLLAAGRRLLSQLAGDSRA